jgi:hypothetical protein
MRALRSAGELAELDAAKVADAFLAALPGFVHARRVVADL